MLSCFGGRLRGTIFVLSILIWTISGSRPAGAQQSVEADEAQISAYIDALKTLPADKRELMETVAREWSEESQKALKTFLLSTPFYSVSAFAKALENRDDPAALRRYLDELGEDDGTRIKLLFAISQQLNKNPEKLENMMESIEEINYFIEKNRRTKTRLGFRIFNFGVLGTDMTALLYDTWSNSSPFVQKTAIIGHADLINFCMAGMITAATYKELAGLKSTLPSIIARWKEARRSQRNLIAIEAMLKVIQKDPGVVETVVRHHYLASPQAEKAGFEAFGLVRTAVEDELAMLSQMGSVGSEAARFRLAQYNQTVNLIRATLSPAEIAVLAELSGAPIDETLPLSLREKLRSIGATTFATIETWKTKQKLKRDELYKRALLEKTDMQDDELKIKAGASGPLEFNTAGLALASLLIGLKLAVGDQPVLLDQYILSGAAAWYRNHVHEFMVLAQALVVVPLAYHFYMYVRAKMEVGFNGVGKYLEFLDTADAGLSSTISRSWMNKITCRKILKPK